ncbi:MAG: hypothetical protein ACTHKV_01750 [Flavipsychrobacter sp.]
MLISTVIVIVQGFVGLTGFYRNNHSRPPHFVLLMVPAIILIAIVFILSNGRKMIDKMNTEWLILIHMVRLPVEIVLFNLYLQNTIPQLMTFEGRNPDILSGISALLVWWLYKRGRISAKVLMPWNIICLLFLANIVINAILSVPSPLQQFAFDQPNIAILYFPYVWLPAFIVPVVLFAHLSSLYLLRKKISN